MHAPTCDPGNCEAAHAQHFDASLPDLCTRRVRPGFVVVDERDGFIFNGDGSEADARRVAASRNWGLTPERQTYAVYALTRLDA